jgi:hypothetical protein
MTHDQTVYDIPITSYLGKPSKFVSLKFNKTLSNPALLHV